MKGKLSLLKESLHNTNNNISKSYSNVFKTQVSPTTELIPYNNTKYSHEHTFNVQTMPVQTVGNKLEQLQLQQRHHNMIVPRDRESNCAVKLKNKSVNNKNAAIHLKDITKNTKTNAKHLKTKMQSLLKEASITPNDYDSSNSNNKSKNKLARLERKSKQSNVDTKIKREIAKFTSNLRSSNSKSKNKPIINLNANENSRNYNSNYNSKNLSYSIVNPKPNMERNLSYITSSGSLKRNSYEMNKTVSVPFKQDGVKYNAVSFIKVAKIDLIEKKRKIKNDLDEFSNSFEKKNNSYIYMKYRNIKNKMQHNNSNANIFANQIFMNQLTN